MNRAILNRKLHALLGKLVAKSGGELADLKADFCAAVTRETRGPVRQTVHSSELTDIEYDKLLRRVTGAANAAGIKTAPRPPLSRRAGEGPGVRALRRLPVGATRLRTPEQTRVITQLVARLAGDGAAPATAAPPDLAGVLAAAPDSAKARTVIAGLIARVVVERNLVARADRALHSGVEFTVGEENVLRLIATARARGVRRLTVGAVLWACDLMERAA